MNSFRVFGKSDKQRKLTVLREKKHGVNHLTIEPCGDFLCISVMCQIHCIVLNVHSHGDYVTNLKNKTS